ncbi:MAG TPA: aryl-sulfate sulfotransferase [Ignavibacteria bacterium]|nr:aryl-sulfate sulfotransferase [Ignavibacteria bacterium]HMQ97717.1 aryl-sulfate sulfotransferase [Ignavibacteria bacterium]
MIKRIFIFIAFVLLPVAVNAQVIPQYSVVINDPDATTGYYFIHGLKQNTPTENFNSMILDRFGQIVFIKKYTRAQNDFKLQPDGTISHAAPTGSNAGARYHILDSMFNVIDSVKCPGGIFTDLHDVQLLPNGNYLVLAYELITMDLSSYNYFNGNGSPGSSAATVLSVIVQELDDNNNAVFTWKASEHFDFSDVTEEWLFSPTLVDWTHSNALDRDTDGNILLSSRHFNEITKINRQTGAIMWRLGGKRNQFTFSSDPYSGFWGQHDIRRISNGNITLFDNGYNLNPIHPARALEYQLNETNLTANLVWSYTYGNNIYSRFTGGMQRLANGNTVIDWGKLSGGNSTFSVVKPNGNIVMEVSSSDSMTSYRTFNYPELPFTLQRPPLNCSVSGGKHFLEAPEGHSSYLWSTGEITRTIEITSADTFYVYVPYGAGGYISSERIVITDIKDPCSQVIGIVHSNTEIPENFRLYQNYPNPFNPVTKIKFELPEGNISGKNVQLVIFDVTGREIKILYNGEYITGSYEMDFDASDLPSGVYYYRLTAGSYSDVKKMVLLK